MSKQPLTAKEIEERKERKLKRMNGVQFTPVSSLHMMALMLWLSGNDIHIFSIMITGSAIWSPISSMLNVGQTFQPFENDDELKDDFWRCKLVYLAMCFVALLVGLAKLHFMGLLPTAAADWLDHSPPTYVAIARQYQPA